MSFRIPHPSPQLLLTTLLTYFSSSKSDQFAHGSFLCAICLSERKGAHCLALSCGHVFCKACLVDMWGLHVREGQVSQVGCPEHDCGKTNAKDANSLREATEDEVRAVLSENELDRWKWLRKKRDLERDPTMIHCPMEYCQEPVTKPTSSIGGDDDESGWARLRTCTACGYSFCAFCRRTWSVLTHRPYAYAYCRHQARPSHSLPTPTHFQVHSRLPFSPTRFLRVPCYRAPIWSRQCSQTREAARGRTRKQEMDGLEHDGLPRL